MLSTKALFCQAIFADVETFSDFHMDNVKCCSTRYINCEWEAALQIHVASTATKPTSQNELLIVEDLGRERVFMCSYPVGSKIHKLDRGAY